jgi:hypothetical protein
VRQAAELGGIQQHWSPNAAADSVEVVLCYMALRVELKRHVLNEVAGRSAGL